MTTNAQKLKKVMRKYKFTRLEVADMMGVTRQAVDSWLAPNTAACYRPMADRWVDYLTIKVRSLYG